MKTKKVIIIIVIISLYFLYKYFFSTKSQCSDLEVPVFNAEELSKYKGTKENNPIYLAFEGCVYDVTEGKDKFYGPDMEYNYLTGVDATSELHIAGGGIIKSKYKIVGKYRK